MRTSLALLMSCVVALPPSLVSSASLGAGWPEPAVAVADRTDALRYDGIEFSVLDPETLETLASTGNVKSSGATIMAPEGWALSADGLTLTAFESGWNPASQQMDRWLVVSEGLSGVTRGRFALPAALGFPRLSANGERLVASLVNAAGEPLGGAYVLDTRDGRVLAHVPWLNLDESWTTIDAAARRVIQIQLAGLPQQAQPAVRVVDLDNGVASAWLDLTGVMPAEPGLGASEDGRRLAIFDDETERLTLVDLNQMVVERSIDLAPAASASGSLVGPLLGLLEAIGIAPRVAHAKPEHGAQSQLVFSTDGQHLYVFGSEAEPTGPDQWLLSGKGIRMVDLAQGSVVATGLTDRIVARVLPTSNGTTVFAWGPVERTLEGYTHTTEHVLYRLDGKTLEQRTARTYVGERQVLVWPTAFGAQ